MIEEYLGHSWELLSGKSDFASRLSELTDPEKPVMFDTETCGLYGKIRLAQFNQAHWERPILVEWPEIYQLMTVLDTMHLVMHVSNYDISTVQANAGIYWVPKNFDDTFYLSRLHYYKAQSFTLDDCLKYAIGEDPYEQLGEDKKDLQKSDWSAPSLAPVQKLYAAFDVKYLPRLWDVLEYMVNGTEEQIDYNYKLDMSHLRTCLRFQCNGLPVDNERLIKRYQANEAQIAELAVPVNVNSWQQVRPYIGSNESNDLALAKLSAMGNERAAKVRKTRKLKKENSFLKKFSTQDGHVYGRFAPMARSGRDTCKNDNLQQLPRPTKECFGVAEDSGLVMGYSDFSQLELRCIAVISNDETMVKLFRDGIDIHTYVAQLIFEVEEPTPRQRSIAKTANFSLLYGGRESMFLSILLTTTGILMTFHEAKRFRRKWLELFPGVAAWQEKGESDYNHGRHWQTPMGRRYVGKLNTDQLNIEVQGMGAEVAKLANHNMDKRMDEYSKNTAMTPGIRDYWLSWKGWQRNFVHDSYIFVMPNHEDVYKPLADIVIGSMKEAWYSISEVTAVPDLPMPVQVDIGYNWGDIDCKNPITIYSKKVA